MGCSLQSPRQERRGSSFLVPDNLRLPLIFAGGFLVAAFLFGPLLRLIEHRVQREKTVEPHGSIGEGEH
jgi:hypothetical protein